MSKLELTAAAGLVLVLGTVLALMSQGTTTCTRTIATAHASFAEAQAAIDRAEAAPARCDAQRALVTMLDRSRSALIGCAPRGYEKDLVGGNLDAQRRALETSVAASCG